MLTRYCPVRSTTMTRYRVFMLALLFCGAARAQNAAPAFNFLDYQRSIPRISDMLRRKEDTLMKQFQEKHLLWPARYVYLRSFKFDSQLEVWVKNSRNDKYQLFKTYRVCALAGTLGPKRMQGDYQVPEGFYYINEFNPKSTYHLSLGLNYPNASDRILGDSLQPGGDIYIHGSCVTTGCIPITDSQIEELYVLAAYAKAAGQDFIPVHIFPINFRNAGSSQYLNKYLKDFPEYSPLVQEMKQAFNYFEKERQLPVIMVGREGDYVVQGAPATDTKEPMVKEEKKEIVHTKTFTEDDLAKSVDKLPVYPGGNEGFQLFLDKLSRDMVAYLDKGQDKTFVMMEFVIDKDGRPAYANVEKGGNETLNARLIEKFEAMPFWTPAIRLDKPVAVKLKQTISIEKP